MSASPSPAPSRSWKTDAPPPPPREPRWRREDAPPRTPRRSRRLRFLLGFLFLAVLCGLLTWVILWLRPPKGTAVLILTAGYEDNLAVPHNVAGRAGATAFADMVRGLDDSDTVEGGRLHLRQAPRLLVNVEEWDRDLNRTREKTVLLFVALHGGADPHGAYLLPQNALSAPDAEGLHKDETLRLEKMLDRLARVPRDRNVVLVLDATQVPAHWPLGMLHNSFARAVDALEEKIAAIPNLIVLCASDVDQRSWVCDDLRRTVFTHFLIEGLKGYADGAADGVKDSKVDAAELHYYVSQQVARWARANRAALQTPVLRPRGTLGMERARKIHLTVAPTHLAAPPMAAPVFDPPAALAEEWRKYRKLAEESPAPAVCSPHLWRRYQDMLLRYESLLEAGDADAARTLANRLFELEQGIRQARTLTLGAVGNSLGMASVAGMEASGSPAADRALLELWKAFPKDHGKKWAELLTKADGAPGGRTALRLQLTELLLQRAADDPGENLGKAAQLLHTLDDPLRPRPAEAHFLVMLHRDLARHDPASASAPPLLPAHLLSAALRVRLRAERAAVGLTSADQSTPADRYPDGARVVPWIRARVADADKLRRLGEDLLFTTDRLKWKEAEELLTRADRLYRVAQEEAVRVRTAFAVRDRVLAALPHYAHWLGRRSLAEDSARPREDGALLERLEQLCKDAHALANRLEGTAAKEAQELPAARATDVQYQDLAERATAVRRGFDDLEKRFGAYAQVLDEADSAGLWRSLDDLLRVPGGDVKRRLEILGRKAHVSRKFFNETLHLTGAVPAIDPRGVAAMVKKAAEVEGRLALALLGERAFNEVRTPQDETFEQVRRLLGPFRIDEKWWLSIDRAGEQIGRLWRLLPEKIGALLPKKGQKADPAQAVTELQTAARLTRLVDGPGSLFLTRNPTAEYRRLLVEDLLLWQGDRTLRDFWYEEDPVKVPYYRVAGRASSRDARHLDEFGLRAEGIQQLEQGLARDGNLRVVLGSAPGLPGAGAAAPVLHMTGEEEFPLRYRLAPDGNLAGQPGYPVVWVKPGPGLQALEPPAGRRVAQVVGPEASLRCVLTSPELRQAELKPPEVPKALPSSVTVHGLYRGRQFGLTTPVLLHPLPDVTVSVLPPPLNASLAVRAPREVVQASPPKGALAIVLDCSGSMGAPPGKPAEASKFAEAADALRRLLRKLPKGTVVSVWVFGQAVEPGKTVDNPEDTIQHLLSPTAWDPADEGQANELMTKVNEVQPWNKSPIVRAMWRAVREDLRGADGPKTLLVITDGMDNRFEEDKLLNRDRKGIGPFLAANFRDVRIQMIGFKIPGAEKDKALEQFQEITRLPLKGEFATVEDATELVGKMLRTVVRRGLTYRVDREDDLPAPGQAAPRGVSVGEANEQWLPGGLAPGTYKVALDALGARSRGVQLDRGDLLLLEAVPDAAGKLGLQRALWSETVLAGTVPVERGGWRLAVLENRSVDDRGLEMLLTLEKRGDAPGEVLRQVRPALTWIEVTPPPDVKTPFHRRWGYHAGYPAPAWTVTSPLWPTAGADKVQVPPQVRVWWSEAPLAAVTPLERGPDFKSVGDLVNRPVRVGDDEVLIESVRVEKRRVETRQAFRSRKGASEVKSCLVVRVRHGRNNPVWVRVKGVEPAGEEHRYYGAAGKYTALFWSVTADEAALALRGLEVVSLAALKHAAAKAECVLEMKNLREPQQGELRPPEPVALMPDERDVTQPAPTVPEMTPMPKQTPPTRGGGEYLPPPRGVGSEEGPYLRPAPPLTPAPAR